MLCTSKYGPVFWPTLYYACFQNDMLFCWLYYLITVKKLSSLHVQCLLTLPQLSCYCHCCAKNFTTQVQVWICIFYCIVFTSSSDIIGVFTVDSLGWMWNFTWKQKQKCWTRQGFACSPTLSFCATMLKTLTKKNMWRSLSLLGIYCMKCPQLWQQWCVLEMYLCLQSDLGDERLQTEAVKTGKFFFVNLARQCHLNQFRCTFLLVLQFLAVLVICHSIGTYCMTL